VRSVVVALGGHCLVPGGGEPDVSRQRANVRAVVEALAPLLLADTPIALVHGNGPQVGHALLRSETARKRAYELPLDVCVAQTQGEIGYLLQEGLDDLFARHRRERAVIAAVTRVLVAPPGDLVARKPVGPFYAHRRGRGFPMARDPAGRGYRRLVPSPRPVALPAAAALRVLFQSGVVVIAAGGGGIPAAPGPDGIARPVEGVVDKDWSAALLAEALGASTLLDLTEVDAVRLAFGTPDERPLGTLGVAEARRLLAAGAFAEGSMAPKIEAAVHFVEHGGAEVVITSPERALVALAGRAGTRISRDGRPADAVPRDAQLAVHAGG
jgi:carbamate kinase